MIQPEVSGRIKNGHRLLIYRETTITHPVTDEVLGTVRDNIVVVPVLRVRKHTITAIASEPEFGMIELGDEAKSVRGSVKPLAGSVYEIGQIGDIDAENRKASCQVLPGVEMPSLGDDLTVVRYAGAVTAPDTDEVLAVIIEPVANLRVTEIDAGGQLRASYKLVDKKLGWIETGDAVVKRTGNMLTESFWFQEPPDGFSESWVYGRKYLRAVRFYNSGDYREAILELKDVVQIDPDYADAAYLLGLCYESLNRHGEAEKVFKESLERRPADAKVWTALAYLYLKQGKFQAAVKSYEKLGHLLPGDSKVWTDMGDIYRMMGDQQKAGQAYRKALEIDGNDEEAIYELQTRKKEAEK